MYLKESKKNDYWVGGEQSGHVIFLRTCEVTGDVV
ncbi:MAG: hypothetical protein ACLTTH_16505 [Holdemanella porci]